MVENRCECEPTAARQEGRLLMPEHQGHFRQPFGSEGGPGGDRVGERFARWQVGATGLRHRALAWSWGSLSGSHLGTEDRTDDGPGPRLSANRANRASLISTRFTLQHGHLRSASSLVPELCPPRWRASSRAVVTVDPEPGPDPHPQRSITGGDCGLACECQEVKFSSLISIRRTPARSNTLAWAKCLSLWQWLWQADLSAFQDSLGSALPALRGVALHRCNKCNEFCHFSSHSLSCHWSLSGLGDTLQCSQGMGKGNPDAASRAC